MPDAGNASPWGNARIRAPWTEDQVGKLNRWQGADTVHPFTCPGQGCLENVLVATGEGWRCACGAYRQEWAHVGMLSPPPTPERIFPSTGSDDRTDA